jgi:hypothetical protein
VGEEEDGGGLSGPFPLFLAPDEPEGPVCVRFAAGSPRDAPGWAAVEACSGVVVNAALSIGPFVAPVRLGRCFGVARVRGATGLRT